MRLLLALFPLMAFFAAISLRAQVLVTPELQTWAGYDSNRYRESENEESDGYFEAIPALQVSWFASDTTEARARIQHSQRRYLSSTNGQLNTTFAEAGLSWLSGGFGAELMGGGGMFKDTERPDDDSQWLHLAPAMSYTLASGVQFSLRGYASQNNYDSRLTFEGEEESGQYFALRPGFQWPITLDLNLWGETYAEWATANEPVDEYNGYGAEIGLEYDVTRLLQVSVHAWAGLRNYPNGLPDLLVESRTDKPMGVEVRAQYRMTDWLALQVAGAWAQTPSTDGASEYDQLSVQAGLAIAQDFTLLP